MSKEQFAEAERLWEEANEEPPSVRLPTGTHRAFRKLINTRLRRQQLLDGHDPLVLHALIDEAVVRRPIGGPDVHREQLAQLLVVGERPNITVQVIPFAAGGYSTMNGACTIVDYDEPDAYLGYPRRRRVGGQ